jgi:hypothetical protein
MLKLPEIRHFTHNFVFLPLVIFFRLASRIHFPHPLWANIP